VRYLWATVAAICLIGLGGLFVLLTPYPAVGPDWGVELPSSAIWRIFLADLLLDYWFIFIPLVCIACFGVAALFGSSATAKGALFGCCRWYKGLAKEEKQERDSRAPESAAKMQPEK
jgi:hypothetical protein